MGQHPIAATQHLARDFHVAPLVRLEQRVVTQTPAEREEHEAGKRDPSPWDALCSLTSRD